MTELVEIARREFRSWHRLLGFVCLPRTIAAAGLPLTHRCRSNTIGGTDGALLAQETSQCDAFGRATYTVFLDGSSRTRSYACCGLESETDREGINTEYEYDALKRLLVTSRNNIAVSNTLDAAGQTLYTDRHGTNGGFITLLGALYDQAGRRTVEATPNGGCTGYAEGLNASGQFCRTNTFADLGTRIETYDRDGHLTKITGTAVHPTRYVRGVEFDSVLQINAAYTKEVKLAGDFTDTLEWTKRFTDMAGREYLTVYSSAGPSYPTHRSYYNAKGQLWRQVDPDGNSLLYTNLTVTGTETCTLVDTNRNGLFDWSGPDRVTKVVADVITNAATSTIMNRTCTYGYPVAGTSAVLISTTETSVDGKSRWQTLWHGNGTLGVTSRTDVAYDPANRRRYETNTFPDGTKSISVFTNGYLLSLTRFDSNTTPGVVTQTSFAYDAHGRRSQEADARNGATTYGFNDADLVVSVTTPSPGSGQPAQTTTTTFDNMLRPTSIVFPDNTQVIHAYNVKGERVRTYGSRTCPVGYAYDAHGRLTRMTNWTAFDPNGAGSGTRVTSWSYDGYRGWLTAKDYPDASSGNPPAVSGTNGPVYSYTAAGKLAKRIWLRTSAGTNRFETTYGYNSAGDLASVSYPTNTTPGATYDYDRSGRLSTVVRNGITTTLYYNDAGLLTGERYSGGTLNNLAVTNHYDRLLRRLTNGVTAAGSWLAWATNAFDAAGRLQTVGDTNTSAEYSYLANSPLVSTVTFKQGSNVRLTTTQQYDRLNRLTGIASATNGAPMAVVGSTYQYNAANQRVRLTQQDGAYWVYTYDALGQVISGCKYWSDGTPVAGQQFFYGFDNIGNRTGTLAGGDQTGGNLRSATYTVNVLNQYGSRTVPGAADILGNANVAATVSVNADTNVYRRGEYFRKELAVVNTSAAQYPQLTVASTLAGYGSESQTGRVFVAQSPEAYAYDPDGNLTRDGRWTYSWDGENRLTQMIRTNSVPTGAQQQLVFEYDHQGRRIRKQYFTYNTGWQEQTNLLFLYDGWNPLAELNTNAANAKVRTYLWGSDLSGSPQGAGGVGGLLEVAYFGSQTTNAFVAYDGNGNVVALVDASTGATLARYEYAPFGEGLRVSGPMAKGNPIRFSTKYTDGESDLVYYGYRFYNPSAGRWLSRDPLEEVGGPNLTLFTSNNPILSFDMDGRELGFIYCPRCLRPIPPGHSQCSCGYRLPRPLPFNVGRSLIDRRSANMLASWWDDTQFFADHYPGCLSDALAYFRRQINDRRQYLCSGQPIPAIDPYPVYGCLEDSHPQHSWPKDPKQTPLENLFWLGDFEFQFSHFVTLRCDDNKLRYSALIVVVDKLGYTSFRGPPALLNRLAELLFGSPQRTRITAQFTVADTLDCCEKSSVAP